MGLIKSYIFSVVAASMICALLVRLAGTKAPVIKLIASLFLAFTFMRPIAGADLSGLISSIPNAFSNIATANNDWGMTGAQALRKGIQAQTEAYILREADLLGAHIEVEARISEDEIPVPEAITIRGSVSPYERSKLTHILTSELGIRKEDIDWS